MKKFRKNATTRCKRAKGVRGHLAFLMNPKKRKQLYNRLLKAATYFADSMSEETGCKIEPEEILRQSHIRK